MAAVSVLPSVFPPRISPVDDPRYGQERWFWEIEFSLPKLTHYSATTVRYRSSLLLFVTNNTVTSLLCIKSFKYFGLWG